MGPEKVNLGLNSVSVWRNDTTGKKCLSPGEEGNMSDAFSLFPSRFPWSPRDTWREPRGAEKVVPWAGPLLLSWAGLLACRQLMASGQRCRETALPRSSSSAKGSRAEGTACSHHRETTEVEKH